MKQYFLTKIMSFSTIIIILLLSHLSVYGTDPIDQNLDLKKKSLESQKSLADIHHSPFRKPETISLENPNPDHIAETQPKHRISSNLHGFIFKCYSLEIEIPTYLRESLLIHGFDHQIEQNDFLGSLKGIGIGYRYYYSEQIHSGHFYGVGLNIGSLKHRLSNQHSSSFIPYMELGYVFPFRDSISYQISLKSYYLISDNTDNESLKSQLYLIPTLSGGIQFH